MADHRLLGNMQSMSEQREVRDRDTALRQLIAIQAELDRKYTLGSLRNSTRAKGGLHQCRSRQNHTQ